VRQLWFAALIGCSYTPPSPLTGDGPGDSEVIPDAGPCTALGPTCVGSTLRTCTALDQLPTDTPCGWGCDDSTTPHCLAITPAGNATAAADLVGFDGLTPVTLAAATIDSDDASITGSPSVDVRSTPTLAVFRFKELHITGPLKLTGLKAIALVADGEITISAAVSALGCTPSLRDPGPGGAPGGAVNAAGDGPGAGQTSAGTTCGGGGGGHGGTGGTGGAGDPTKCLPGQESAGGIVAGDDAITMLIGGSGGGGGQGGGGGVGGGGGAAIHLVSNTRITIDGSGSINAGGCGGASSGGGGNDSPGGGGSGGTLLLEAPAISSAGTLAVNGGGGGGGRGATPGGNATANREPAPGGPKGGLGGVGGAGAAAATLDGTNGDPGDRSGAGGGGIGRLRFTTKPGTTPTVDNTKLSPALDDSPTAATAGDATLN
jgi:hypothetical protein